MQRILNYAQEIDLVGKLEKGRGFVSRDYYVLTFDDGSNLTSTCGGYEMTEFLKQFKEELEFYSAQNNNPALHRYPSAAPDTEIP